MQTITQPTWHRRPLPDDLIAFGSPEGRLLLQESLAAGAAESFFPLVSHLHTQSEPAWCGLGTLVTVLNALEIDPGRTWKGPWRWFGEELLDCCKRLDIATAEGLTLAEVGCMARCNGAAVEPRYALRDSLSAFRAQVQQSTAAPAGPFVVANYHRAGLGQTGTGHFSPIGAWHPASDRVLVLDVARFKYPPHWVPLERLWSAMTAIDPASHQPRGWLVIQRAVVPQGDEAEARALIARMCPPSPEGTCHRS